MEYVVMCLNFPQNRGIYSMHVKRISHPRGKQNQYPLAWCQLGAGSIKAKITLFRLLSIKLR